jgi:uncharacterized protein involved in high-affinity Fe2+ transport
MLMASNANAGDVQIGTFEKNGMEITAVYIQPVPMEPMMPGMERISDIHLEADIQAIKGNSNGFKEGHWIPYLDISFTITKHDSDWAITGDLMPMAASDGPHYARNIKLDGPGKYHLRYNIDPPSFDGFFRHTDKETGVGSWWEPFSLEWDFVFVGTGKKGAY